MTGSIAEDAIWLHVVSQRQHISSGCDPITGKVGSTTPNNTVSLYSTREVNLDGSVKYTGSGNDRDPILVNVGSTTPNNVWTQQLP
mgnify:CR=1 FL=1